MKKTTIVAFLLLTSNALFASTLSPEVNQLESQWASIYYGKNNSEQRKAYALLLNKAEKLSATHPKAVELQIWKAIIISTNAAFESPFTALESLNNAKMLLEHAIKQKPNALGGAALVTLGTLYYMTPSWPISFGDNSKAEKLLKEAIEINPQSIDANYFYGDYLLTVEQTAKAKKHFKIALQSPMRDQQLYADTQLKKEALIALKNAEKSKLNFGKNKFISLFFSAKTEQH